MRRIERAQAADAGNRTWKLGGTTGAQALVPDGTGAFYHVRGARTIDRKFKSRQTG